MCNQTKLIEACYLAVIIHQARNIQLRLKAHWF
jgi:hypothetical protein